jgi:PKD repeat protein
MRAVFRTAVVLLLGTGLVVGAVRLPDLHARLAGAGSGVTAAAAETPAARSVTSSALVCPGPESVGVKRVDTSTATAPTTVTAVSPPIDLLATALSSAHATLAPSATAAGSVNATGLGGSGQLAFTPLGAPGVAATQTTLPRSILLSGHGTLAPGLAATQVSLQTSGDLRGLSTLACQQPSAQTWLVGGAGTTGHRGRVILGNPTPNAVTVNLTVYGAKGQLTSTAARGIVVKPHKRTVVLLDAIAHGEASPVVHVMASGGVISAVLSDTWLDQTTPAGSDDAAGTMPGRHLVIPGVLGSTTPGSAVLRLAATDRAATVHLRVLGPTGPAPASVDNGQVQVAAGTVKDVDLAGLPVGYDGLELTATAPVVAGVQLRSGLATPGAERDLAWSAAQPAVQGLVGVPLGVVAPPWTQALALTAATGDAEVDLVYVAADGTESTQPVTVPAGTTKEIVVPAVLPATTTGTTTATGTTTPAPVSVWIRPRSGAVTAALATSYADAAGPLLSVAPLADTPLTFTPVAVHPLAG